MCESSASRRASLSIAIVLALTLPASARQERVRVPPPPTPPPIAQAPDPDWVDDGSAPLSAPGTIRSRRLLDDIRFPFQRTIGERDALGSAVSVLGDIDGDGEPEIGVGAAGDFFDTGAVWFFTLTPTREVDHFVKLGPVEGLLTPILQGDRFGSAIV